MQSLFPESSPAWNHWALCLAFRCEHSLATFLSLFVENEESISLMITTRIDSLEYMWYEFSMLDSSHRLVRLKSRPVRKSLWGKYVRIVAFKRDEAVSDSLPWDFSCFEGQIAPNNV